MRTTLCRETRGRARGAPGSRGFTLVELLVAAAILSFVSIMIYGAFSGMRASKDGVQRINDRYHEGRNALARMTRELSAAYISKHLPIQEALIVQRTAFIGSRGTPADRLDFNTFANRRLDKDTHESDQAEVSYFGSRDPKGQGKIDLVRRVSSRLDLEPDQGGRVEVLANDIDLFELEYLDPLTGHWEEIWDTTQAIGQADRMPLAVRIVLVLNGGRRAKAGRSRDTIRLVTKIGIPVQRPLTFAIQ